MSRDGKTNIRVGIFGTYGFGNMGDAAVADGTIAGIRRHIKDAEVIGICQQPENVAERHKIDAVSMFRVFIKNSELLNVDEDQSDQQPNSEQQSNSLKEKIKSIKLLYWPAKLAVKVISLITLVLQEMVFTFTIFKQVRNLDLMVMSGSGQLNEEWGGPWRYPFSLFRWCVLARLAGCKVAFLSVGAGEVVSPWSKYFLSMALRSAHYISVRDSKTQTLLLNWKIAPVNLVPDMAFAIKFEQKSAKIPDNAHPIVAINPISYCDPRTWNIADADAYLSYITKMSEICNWLLKKQYNLLFIPNDLVMDNLTIDDIITNIKCSEQYQNQILRPDIKSYADVFSAFNICDFAVCCRFHGLLFSFMSEIPAIALGHHYKFHKLSEEMGQQKYSFDIDSFSVKAVTGAFDEIVGAKAEIQTTIAKHSREYAELVEQQFQKMATLIQ